jgi:hypothetical protein
MTGPCTLWDSQSLRFIWCRLFFSNFPYCYIMYFRLLHSPVKLGQMTGDEFGVGPVIQI